MTTQQLGLVSTIDSLRKRISTLPLVACVLGSGLGDFAEQLSDRIEVNSVDVPDYPISSVPGHAGKLVFGKIANGNLSSPPLLVFKGRVHFYETSSLRTVLTPIKVAAALGCKYFIVTNAAGGINRGFRPGQLMLIRDVIDLTFIRRKTGTSTIGDRPSSPHNLFDETLQTLLRMAARDLSITLVEGTYCWLKGPTYETAAEIEMLRRIGADAVGMSTVPEIVEANDSGMKVVGISLISNLATGITGEKLSHEEVTETANRIKDTFTRLLREFLLRLSASQSPIQ